MWLTKNILLIGLLILGSTALTQEVEEKKKDKEDGNLYQFLWLDQDKKVFVLQNKVYVKKHSQYANISFVKGMEEKFQSSKGVQLKYGFYLTEEFAIEGFSNIYSNSNNSAYAGVQFVAAVAPFVRKIKMNTGAMAVWSPFYGKINTFNKIIYFDWYFGAGLSYISAESNKRTVVDGSISEDIYDSESFLGLPLKTGFRVYINKRYHVGLEYMNTSYWAPSAVNPNQKKWKTRANVLVNFGLSF